MMTLHEETMEKINYYKSSGFNVVIKWECELEIDMETDFNIRDFFKQRRYSLKNSLQRPPLEPRDGFFGGRTNTFKFYHEAKNGGKIRYLDFTSLYPYIEKYGKFPRGKPRIIKTFESTCIDAFEGMIFCKVLPPGNLHIPVLPFRLGKKLLFPLCRTCAETRQQTICKHSTDERVLVGVWVSDEIKLAVDRGYQVIELYEVWHFDETRQRGVSKEGGLFDEFQNTFLKIKIANSGWPKNDMTLEEKIAYLETWKSKEGIVIGINEVVKNEGMRTNGKGIITSRWGKHGQKSNQKHTEYIKKPDDFYSLLSNPTIEVSDALIVSPTVLEVTYSNKYSFVIDPAHSNIIIAAYTTAQARIKLFSVMEPLGERLLYCDTDSVFFESNNGDQDPETGEFLGELTDEIHGKYGDGFYISRFLSGGPKNYALEIKNKFNDQLKYEIKVKGISLNVGTEDVISFESMKQVILDGAAVLKVPQTRFYVDNQLNLFTKRTNKKYRFFYDKRRIGEDFSTLSLGRTDI